ncbi:MAG: DNA-binding protein WhiA [Mycoplasmatales bacterium]
MTFSKELKEELVHLDFPKKADKVCLAAILQSISSINVSDFGRYIEIKTSLSSLARLFITKLKENYPFLQVETLVQTQVKFAKKVKVYIVRVVGDINMFLYDLKLIERKDASFILSLLPITHNRVMTVLECQIYVRTYFICVGTINNPRKLQQYHLEFTSNHDENFADIANILKHYDVNMKVSKRKRNYALYLNRSEEISDFLKFIGATKLLFEYEDYRFTRDIRANTNRIMNAEIANEMKRQATSDKQIVAIEYLMSSGEINKLGTKTIEVAKLRNTYPGLSLQELADQTKGEISKSNISYHLRIISKMYNELNGK